MRNDGQISGVSFGSQNEVAQVANPSRGRLKGIGLALLASLTIATCAGPTNAALAAKQHHRGARAHAASCANNSKVEAGCRHYRF